MKRVLFICTHNSARSQMAEGLVNHDLKGRIEAFSAGTDPTRLHPLAVKVMAELGIDVSRQRTKGVEEFEQEKFDYVITLCDQAAESCPVFFGEARRIHMGFQNPASAAGSEEEKLAVFRKSRDQIRERMLGIFSKEDPF